MDPEAGRGLASNHGPTPSTSPTGTLVKRGIPWLTPRC